MPTESTSLKNVSLAGDSTTTNEMAIGKSNTYQRTFLIVAGSLLTLLVWIAMAGKSAGHYFQSSEHEMADDAVALADYQVDSTNLALTNNIFGGAVSENKDGENQKKHKDTSVSGEGTYKGGLFGSTANITPLHQCYIKCASDHWTGNYGPHNEPEYFEHIALGSCIDNCSPRDSKDCRCDSCTNDVLNNKIATDSAGGFTCQSRISWLQTQTDPQTDQIYSKRNACIKVSEEFPDKLCGPFCNPTECRNQQVVDFSGPDDAWNNFCMETVLWTFYSNFDIDTCFVHCAKNCNSDYSTAGCMSNCAESYELDNQRDSFFPCLNDCHSSCEGIDCDYVCSKTCCTSLCEDLKYKKSQWCNCS